MVCSIFLVSFASPFLSFISVLSFSSFLLFLSFPSRSFLFPLDPNLNFPTINTKTHTLADIFSPLFFCFFLHPLSNLILALPSPSLLFFFSNAATVNVLSQRIDELEREKDRINDAVGKHVFTLDTRITKEVDSIKEDLEHKFALQVAENKRLLNQLVKQKNEAGSMRKYIEALEERIRLLQDEMGV